MSDAINMRAERDDWLAECCRQADKIAEAAAFLDGLAKWLEVGGVWNTGRDPAADCRAMAKRLRRE
jgi:hypothetical protein